MRKLYAVLAVLLAAGTALASGPCRPKFERKPINQATIENIQKLQVNSGDELWRLDANKVAQREAVSLDPALTTAKPDVKGSEMVQMYTYRSGSTTYVITLKKFDWLLPYSGIYKMMMWTVTDVRTICPAARKK